MGDPDDLWEHEGKPSDRLAVFNHFYDGSGDLPFQYSEAAIWDRLGVLPSWVEGENAVELLSGLELLSIGRIAERMREDLTKLAPWEYKVAQEFIALRKQGLDASTD